MLKLFAPTVVALSVRILSDARISKEESNRGRPPLSLCQMQRWLLGHLY